jgi:hypothetical protein
MYFLMSDLNNFITRLKYPDSDFIKLETKDFVPDDAKIRTLWISDATSTINW